MAERRPQGLERVLGTNALFSTAYGNVGSSIYWALGLVAGYALGLTPVVFVVAGVIFFFIASTYAEATAMLPEAGGSASFARRAFNEFASFLAAWSQMLTYVATLAIAALFIPHYLGGLFWEPLRGSPGDVVIGIGVVALLIWLNVRGVKETARLGVVLAVADLLTQLGLVVLGVVLVLSPGTLVGNVDLGVAPEWRDFLVAVPIALVASTGIEAIANLAGEARDPDRTIPTAMNRVVIAVFAIYALLPAVALSALPVDPVRQGTELGLPEEEGGFAGDPVLGVTRALELGPLQGVAELYVGLLAATVLFLAADAALRGVSRLVHLMGMYRQVPDGLRRLHGRYRTPWIGIVVFGAAASLLLLPGQAAFLAGLIAFGAMLSFTVAHLAVIRLRGTEPDAHRPYRMPGRFTVRGQEVPVFALVGGVGCALAFAATAVLHPVVAATGAAWMGGGVLLYAAYRRRIGLDLTTTARVASPSRVVEHEAEYDSILVAFPSGYDAHVMATAQKLAARRRRGIHVLVPVEVPSSYAMGAHLPDEERAAQAIVEQAKVQGGGRVTGHYRQVRAGQTGRWIVDEARAMRANAIVIPLPRRRPGQTLFGKTLETVLAERPCRVVIESAPGTTRTREVARR